ncbi:acetyl-CoA carboxylase carboxyl transferase subunit alpha [Ligilactobacillus sp. WC1T17]|uniref:acetyl-CoA carboxytransferase n=1 Tax=Ligilactobacillus ruminis TaxID=1623 RepID=A0ABY1AAJ9_9LACO|nr:acetyl-CoA carboxylase carboxyl transferase subunit alpha [Ligilactobacillus ruminis]
MKLKKEKTAAEIVALSRAPEKITTDALIHYIFSNFIEMHGDRQGHDDPAIVAGIGLFRKRPVTIIATDKGQTPAERVAKNFGCPTPGGYRKALRLAKQAEKFKRPVIALVNTSGAYPGKSAEEQGQGEAIARNLLEFSNLKVPFITVIFGEGGSGGALALACGDEVWMLENSMYSVLSPEGFASILWKDSKRSDEACEVMQLTPRALLKHDVIEGIIPEHKSKRQTAAEIAKILEARLTALEKLTPEQLISRRHARYRKF